MFSLIDRLRKKSNNKKKLVALMVSGGFTFFIFIFWFSGNYLERNSYLEKDDLKTNEISPFEVLVSYSSDLVSSVSNVFSDAKSFFQDINLDGAYSSVLKEETKEREPESFKKPEEESEKRIYKIKDREGFIDKESEEVNLEDEKINID